MSEQPVDESGTCPVCTEPTAKHVQARNCVPAVQNESVTHLFDLPIFGRMWAADAAEIER